jgi:hypothetical protein
MKKTITLLLFVAGTMAATAQLKPPVTKTTMQAKVLTVAQTPTTDLALSILSIEDNSTPMQNQFTVHYMITNTGNQDINRYVNGPQSIHLTGNFAGPTTEAATFWGNASGNAENFQMVSFEDTHTGNAVLKPGESSKGTIKVCKYNPSNNYALYLNATKYKFVLKVDSKNEIAEANENNNTAEYPLPLHVNTNAELFLTAVTVTVQTGNDNKEANNSDVTFSLSPTGIANKFELSNYRDEIKVNSTASILLNSLQAVVSPQNTLEYYKQKGLRFMIKYNNRVFPTDAWKLNNVSLKLDFKDRFGNDLRSVTINFPKANGILGFRFGDDALSNKNQMRWLILDADGNFNAKGEAVFTLLP